MIERYELVETTHANWPRIPRQLRPKRFYFSSAAANRAIVLIACWCNERGFGGPVYRVKRLQP